MSSMMLEEALQADRAVERQGVEMAQTLAALGHSLAGLPVSLVLTVARGSSDHACSYLAYLIMQRLGIPVVSLPMSVLTLHDSPLQVRHQLAIAISQSGASPDLVSSMAELRDAGARTVALVNARNSELAQVCEAEIALCAGPEKAWRPPRVLSPR